MKIVNIVPGFGGTFYCGNCLRDSGYTKSLIDLGHDAMMLPIYLPLTIEQISEKSDTPIFYGAVSIFLKQKVKFLRKMPKWLEKFLNSNRMLKYAAKKAGSTRTKGLEGMTISMLMGKDGNQQKELEELIDFLEKYEKPDIVHLSNALLLGLTKQIKERLKIPVICSLQDEDVWVDAMAEKYISKVWNLMAEKAKDVDAFIAVSNYYANEMKEKMKLDESKLHVVPIGIETELYKPNIKPAKPVIGYMSRMYKEHGFGLLIDAFIKLKQKPEFKEVKLHLTGGYTADDKKYVKKQLKKIKQAGLENFVEMKENYEVEHRYKFFNEISVLSVPVLKGEAFGTYILESMACEIPVIQPALGAFTELVKNTGGGDVYFPNTVDALVKKWEEIILKKEVIEELGKKGRESVLNDYTIEKLTKKILDIYIQVSKN